MIGCNQNASEDIETTGQNVAALNTNKQVNKTVNSIEVKEHMNGGGYTFIKGDFNGKETWIAVTEMEVKDGETLYFSGIMEMRNFEAKSVNKKFDSILFVSNISRSPEQSSTAKSNSNGMGGMMPGNHTKPKIEKANVKVEPLADGLTVEKINLDRKNLVGKTVKVKGVVVKYNGGIMNTNWIHIQDGTGTGSNNDLAVTSDSEVKVGDTVIIEGKVTVDKDFGAGYFYDVIIENAKVIVEKKS